MKFKLITYIDRADYTSETFIKFYLKTFDHNEFHFLVNKKTYDSVSEYLKSKGFSDENFEKLNKPKFGFGESIPEQNRVKRNYIKDGYCVVYADLDELIYCPNLKEYITNSNKTQFRPIGAVIVQNINELDMDTSKPILEQRSYFLYDEVWYSKVCILKEDFHWTAGRHNKRKVPLDRNIILFDTGRICKKMIFEKNKQNPSIYSSIHHRYRNINESEISKQIDILRPKLVNIKELLTDLTIF